MGTDKDSLDPRASRARVVRGRRRGTVEAEALPDTLTMTAGADEASGKRPRPRKAVPRAKEADAPAAPRAKPARASAKLTSASTKLASGREDEAGNDPALARSVKAAPKLGKVKLKAKAPADVSDERPEPKTRQATLPMDAPPPPAPARDLRPRRDMDDGRSRSERDVVSRGERDVVPRSERDVAPRADSRGEFPARAHHDNPRDSRPMQGPPDLRETRGPSDGESDVTGVGRRRRRRRRRGGGFEREGGEMSSPPQDRSATQAPAGDRPWRRDQAPPAAAPPHRQRWRDDRRPRVDDRGRGGPAPPPDRGASAGPRDDRGGRGSRFPSRDDRGPRNDAPRGPDRPGDRPPRGERVPAGRFDSRRDGARGHAAPQDGGRGPRPERRPWQDSGRRDDRGPRGDGFRPESSHPDDSSGWGSPGGDAPRDRDAGWEGRGGRRRRRGRRGPNEPSGGNDFAPRPRQLPDQPANLLPDRDPFTELVSIDPDERIDLETDTEEISMRVVDLVTPIGKGQRALIVAPPKTGKTTLLMQLARAISENHPEVDLLVMLIDERPEEVTAFKRAGYGTVLASSNDEPTKRHLQLTQHVSDIARRKVLEGKDVCILLDSITRMARAHNIAAGGGRTMSGGLDTRALERPKRFFGAARNIHGGGSLTILATALIDTGSRMDEIIFQEFKGTGNSELQLDRRLAERRIWPAIDIMRSGTRKEEKLFEPAEYEGVVALRRALSGKPSAEAMQMLLTMLKNYKSNREFLLDVAKRAASVLG